MAQAHGKDSYFSVDSDNLSTYLTSVSITESNDVAETSTMTLETKTFIGGLGSWTVSIAGVWDSTASTGPDAILTALRESKAAVAMEYGPEGNANGDVKRSGNVICTGYVTNSSLTDAVMFTAEFQGTGTLTTGTFSA